jgi:hypothetical protein
MTGRPGRAGAVPVSDLATALLDPVLRKRAGMTVGLVQSWDEIVGARLSSATRPERIAWPRRMHEDDPFEPATLIIACEGAMALRLQHETGEIIGRVNAFLGFQAIGRIKIVQKPVTFATRDVPRPPRPLRPDENARLARTVAAVEDDGLRAALERLGRSVIGSKG